MCLVANAKEYDKVVKAREEPTFWQVKAVKLFAKRLDLEKNLAERKAAKKKQDGISKAARNLSSFEFSEPAPNFVSLYSVSWDLTSSISNFTQTMNGGEVVDGRSVESTSSISNVSISR